MPVICHPGLRSGVQSGFVLSPRSNPGLAGMTATVGEKIRQHGATDVPKVHPCPVVCSCERVRFTERVLNYVRCCRGCRAVMFATINVRDTENALR